MHLSPDVTTARAAGTRCGKPVVLEVDAPATHHAGHLFYLYENGVWLTDHVPVSVISFRDKPADCLHPRNTGRSNSKCPFSP